MGITLSHKVVASFRTRDFGGLDGDHGWLRLWPHFVWPRFARWARRRMRPPVRFAQFHRMNELAAALHQLLVDEHIPHRWLGPDCADGRIMPPALSLDLDGDSRASFGAWHVHPGRRDEVLILRPHGPYWLDSHALAAFHRRSDLERWVRASREHGTARRRRHRGPIVKNLGRFRPREAVGWDDVILPADLLADIRRNIEGFFSDRGRFARHDILYQRGYLLAGPPGNGKTLLARAISHEVRAPFLLLLGQDDPAHMELVDLFHDALDLAPCIVCLEDIDLLLESKAISRGHLLRELDGFAEREGILVLATTNRPERLDASLILRPGRFDRVWYIPDPAPPERARLLGRLTHLPEDDPTILRLADSTDGFSMAMVREVYSAGCLSAFAERRQRPGPDDLRRSVEVLRRHQELVHAGFAPNRIGFREAL